MAGVGPIQLPMCTCGEKDNIISNKTGEIAWTEMPEALNVVF